MATPELTDEKRIDNLNDINNKLLLKYDNNFNTLYDKSTELNKGIMNKEELITQNLDYSNAQDQTISILQYTIFLVIIYFILFTLHAMQKITTKILMIGFIFILIIYVFTVYYNVIYNRQKSLALLSAATGKSIIQTIANTIADKKGYQCPSDCDQNSGVDDQLIQSAGTNPILDKQSSSNVWLEGDKSMNFYNYENYYPSDPKQDNAMADNYSGFEPKPFFRGINADGATYYHCKMKVNYGDNTGVPMKGQSEIFTTIPCNQMNGFMSADGEFSKFICSNSSTITDFYTKDDKGKITVDMDKCNGIV